MKKQVGDIALFSEEVLGIFKENSITYNKRPCIILEYLQDKNICNVLILTSSPTLTSRQINSSGESYYNRNINSIVGVNKSTVDKAINFKKLYVDPTELGKILNWYKSMKILLD